LAPFAFLGSAYDQRLKALYMEMSFPGILSGNPVMGLFGEGLYNTHPLQRVVASQVDETMLHNIAAAHRQGRRLFIVTTNLDAQRPVLWNMGAIAASGQPGALELFRKVLVASASIPGLFDPVFIDAEANGHHFNEMHVDGGTMTASICRSLATDRSWLPSSLKSHLKTTCGFSNCCKNSDRSFYATAQLI
jgi:predicted acylesterase/phospholipase RssA